MHGSDPATGETETGKSWVWLHWKILSQKAKRLNQTKPKQPKRTNKSRAHFTCQYHSVWMTDFQAGGRSTGLTSNPVASGFCLFLQGQHWLTAVIRTSTNCWVPCPHFVERVMPPQNYTKISGKVNWNPCRWMLLPFISDGLASVQRGWTHRPALIVGWVDGSARERVVVGHFPGDRDSVYIRISFPFKSYIATQGTWADEKNDQGISTAQLLALLSP